MEVLQVNDLLRSARDRANARQGGAFVSVRLDELAVTGLTENEVFDMDYEDLNASIDTSLINSVSVCPPLEASALPPAFASSPHRSEIA